MYYEEGYNLAKQKVFRVTFLRKYNFNFYGIISKFLDYNLIYVLVKKKFLYSELLNTYSLRVTS